jgi:23S rRNA (guanosine2251-2'-O)-methyltransferase
MAQKKKKFVKKQHARPAPPSGLWLYGKHAVEAAFANKHRQIEKVFATQNTLDQFPQLLSDDRKQLPVEVVTGEEISAMLPPEAVHQGIAIKVQPLPGLGIDDLDLNTTHTVLLLDQVTDPHNIGAILRSAVAFNVQAVIMPKANAPAESGVLAKSASGALEQVAVLRVSNLAQAMEQLKKAGFWIGGLDGTAEKGLEQLAGYEKLALVMGAEGKGLRRLTTDNCDFLVKIPIAAHMESLNVSNAAAITLYEAAKRLNKA